MRIYRQVDLVLQNATPELLSLESALAMQGEFIDKPQIGSVIAPQGSGRWQSCSKSEIQGTEGFLRFGLTKGYLEISWSLPHDVAQRRFETVSPEGLETVIRQSGPNLDHLVYLIRFQRADRRPERAAATPARANPSTKSKGDQKTR